MDEQTLQVELDERSYPIFFNETARNQLKVTLSSVSSNGLIVTDENVHACVGQWVDTADLQSYICKAGEQSKCFEQLEEICYQLNAAGVSRDGCLFAFGGGVVGDLGGSAAAIYNRGLPFFQIPTTLLAMVDSSVGGKTGINLPARKGIRGGKNLVGSFWQPRAVFIDTNLLKTLPEREFNAGIAEVIKYGMLADEHLFNQLLDLPKLNWKNPELAEIIRRCCAIKAKVVREDEKETAKTGGRALLNLGHTFAHAIENVAGYGQYLHGEAVGLGLVMAAQLSERMGKTTTAQTQQVTELVARYDLPLALRDTLSMDELMQAMQRDKKVRAGHLRFVIMEAIGKAVTTEDVSEIWVQELWKEIGAK